MKIQYASTAIKELDALPIETRERIITKIHFYAVQNDPLAFTKSLSGYDAYRFRVGKHRIIFELKEKTLVVLAIIRRDSGYKNF